MSESDSEEPEIWKTVINRYSLMPQAQLLPTADPVVYKPR